MKKGIFFVSFMIILLANLVPGIYSKSTCQARVIASIPRPKPNEKPDPKITVLQNYMSFPIPLNDDLSSINDDCSSNKCFGDLRPKVCFKFLYKIYSL